jgi:hypothetical protein
MRFTARTLRLHRTGGMARLVGTAVACALFWQTAAPIYLLASTSMSCCVEAHDGSKCPCRYCTHHRSTVPLLEKCEGGAHHDLATVTIDVFAPGTSASTLAPPGLAIPVNAAVERVPDRVLEVPTPPPQYEAA